MNNLLKDYNVKLDVVAQACNPSVLEAEAGRFAWGRGQSELHSEYEDSLGYNVRFCLKKTKENKIELQYTLSHI